MKFEMRPIQQDMWKALLSCNKGALWAGMGTGKTSIMLYYVLLMQRIDPGLILVFAPLQVAENTWIEQRDEFDEFKNLRIIPITGTPMQRIKALNSKADIYTINYENVVWLKNNLPKAMKFKYIIIDEATRVKSLRLRKGSKSAKAVFKISLGAKYLWELSGTAHINGLIDLWGQLGYIDKGERLGKTFTGYRENYFDAQPRGDFTKYVPKPEAITEIPDKIRDVCFTFKAEDYMDIKQPVISPIRIRLPDKIMEYYNNMEKNMFMELSKTKSITAWFKSAAMMKCMQIANGYIYETRDKWVYLHTEKIKALRSIVAEAAGAPVLLAYCFKADLELLLKNFTGAKYINANNAKKLIPIWNKGDIPLMIGHRASVGHGINLQHGGNILVNYTHDWSPEHRQQLFDRIGPTRQAQSGYDRCVFVYDIIVIDTIDETIVESHISKKNIQEVLDDYTKWKKI